MAGMSRVAAPDCHTTNYAAKCVLAATKFSGRSSIALAGLRIPTSTANAMEGLQRGHEPHVTHCCTVFYGPVTPCLLLALIS